MALVTGFLLVGAQPAFADTKLGHTGSVGKHSLTDTSSTPGAVCHYDRRSGYWGKLVKIVAQPPNMRAVAGKSSQIVGWKFVIQRRLATEGKPGPWEHRYTSPEMTAVTDDSHAAAFAKASAPVVVGPPETGSYEEFRLLVTMIWHRTDGSVQGTARDRVDFYKESLSTGATTEEDRDCDDWVPFN